MNARVVEIGSGPQHCVVFSRDEVTGANVLVALFTERESHAVYFLQEQNMNRLDAVSYISHGVAKRPGMSQPKQVRGTDEEEEGEKQPKQGTEAPWQLPMSYAEDVRRLRRVGQVERRADLVQDLGLGGDLALELPPAEGPMSELVTPPLARLRSTIGDGVISASAP